MEKEIRKLAITILDDPNGISTEAFVLLEEILKKTGSTDIVNEVIYEAGRVFLGEDTVTEMISKLDGNMAEIEIKPEAEAKPKVKPETKPETKSETKPEDLECNISPSDIMKDVRNDSTPQF